MQTNSLNKLPVTVLITFCGEGTEWISNSDVDWDIFSDRKNKCIPIKNGRFINKFKVGQWSLLKGSVWGNNCLLYTSDAADEEDSVDLGGRRIIKKK